MTIAAIIRHGALAMLVMLIAACAAPPVTVGRAPDVSVIPEQCPVPQPCPACQACTAPKPEAPVVTVPPLQQVKFADVRGWATDELAAAWSAFRASCNALRFQQNWRVACSESDRLVQPDTAAIRRYFESQFIPYRVAAPDGSTRGLATGYYEPLLKGSRTRRAPYLSPLYAPPDDLLIIDLGAVHPELKNLRLRGRLDGRRVVPYWTRSEIAQGQAATAGKELLWAEDPIEAFFLEVQGSGRVQLDSGETVRLNYADQNGQPYRSIGRWLIDGGELAANEASMQGIKAWARANPSRLQELLGQNPSYVFFREQPVGDPAAGPSGAMGIPLTPQRSIAVDPKFIPLGAPVFLATTFPNTETPLERLVIAQDTGGAIRGPVRADYFWGFGAEAGALAGRMRQSLEMWVLLPRNFPPPAN